MPSINSRLRALHLSVDRLRDLVSGLGDDQLTAQAYPSEWTVADVLSHIGSGAVIMRRRMEDSLVGASTPEDFAPGVWDVWNAKSPSAKRDDALAADGALVDRIDSLTEAERSSFRFSMGPMALDFDGYVGIRLNEHALHTWDVDVVLHPNAELPGEVVDQVIDNLGLIARFTGKPSGKTRTIVVRTREPERTFKIDFSVESVDFASAGTESKADLEVSAAELIRLVYGRLDPEHTYFAAGDVNALEDLRQAFPGP
jgi:uncharacterized protein (TIGR03083 family)